MEEKWVRQGSKVCLRMMTKEDTDDIIRWRNQDFVRERFIYRETLTEQEHLKWFENGVMTGRIVQFIICLSGSGKPVGSVYFRDIDRQHRKAEYGIFIGEESELGKGIGTEAARLALDYAFRELRLHRVMLRVLSDNLRARRSYERVGFTEEGCLRDDVFLDGKFCDVVLMAVIQADERENGRYEG